jgi:hypothetical protein
MYGCPIAFHTCYKIVHKSSQLCPQLPSINATKNSSYKFKMLFPIAFHTQIIIMDLGFRFRFMVFNATFNNISVILWWSILLVEENRVPGENH